MIAYVTGTIPSWSETFIARELRLLLEAGVPLLPVAVHRGEGDLPPGVPEPHVLATTGGGESRSRNRPLPLPPALRRQLSLFRHREQLAALVALCREHRVTHLHGAFADLPGLLAAAAAHQLGIGYSLSLHAADALQDKYDAGFLLEPARFLAFCNRRVHDEVLQRRPGLAARSHLLPHGILLDDWPLREPTLPASPPWLLFVGRLIPRKRPDLAVRVAERLGATLTVAGDGPLRATLANASHVRLLGVQSPAELRRLMAAQDALLVTSEESGNDMEGLPNVVIEAMATGLPVIATTTGSLDELVTDELAWPCPAGNVKAMAEVCERLVAEPELAEKRLQAARARVERDYDARRLIQAKAELLRQAAEVS